MKPDNSRVADSDGAAGASVREGSDSLDTFFDLLADERRRYVLESLRNHSDDHVPVTDLIDSVTTKVERHPEKAVNRNELEVDLHHQQLPKLAAVGIIDYNARTQTIQVRDAERLKELYERLRDFEHR